MADLFQRVSGEMEPLRGIHQRRVLLPYEEELCEFTGISKDEYFQFLDLVTQETKKRPKAYDLVPDVQATGTELVILAIALVVIGYLLKPKEPEDPPTLTTSKREGRKRFTPSENFDSVQNLIDLGETVPLVFTRWRPRGDGTSIGGVRVNTELLWSQMASYGKYQQFRAIGLVSGGRLGNEILPDYEGYAIGSSSLDNYTRHKVALYFNRGGGRPRLGGTDSNRFTSINNGDGYNDFSYEYDESRLYEYDNRNEEEDVFSVAWQEANQIQYNNRIFSGCRTENVQSVFGVYNPMPNGMRYRVNYELVLLPDGSDNKSDIKAKREKIRDSHPRFCAVDAYKRGNGNWLFGNGEKSLEKGDLVRYKIDKSVDDSDDYRDWGSEDIRNAQDSIRKDADDALVVGETYLIGTCLVVCIEEEDPYLPWEPDTRSKRYRFEVLEHEVSGQDNEIEIRDWNDKRKGYETLTIQKVALGTVTNNRPCQATEIGLKSQVWRRVNGFPNVNSHPGHWQTELGKDRGGTIEDYEDEDGSITLGNMNTYISRLSFFRLQARRKGDKREDGTAKWSYIDDNAPFCIKGQAPTDVYNYIRINHPFGEWDFRFVPYPGNKMYKRCRMKRNRVHLLNSKNGVDITPISSSSYGFDSFSDRITSSDNITYEVQVWYGGQEYYLTPGDLGNKEWFVGEIPDEDESRGEVLSLAAFSTRPVPNFGGWVFNTSQSFHWERSWSGPQDWKRRGAYYYKSGSKTRWRLRWDYDLNGVGSNTLIGTANSDKKEDDWHKVRLYDRGFQYRIADGDGDGRSDDKRDIHQYRLTEGVEGRIRGPFTRESPSEQDVEEDDDRRLELDIWEYRYRIDDDDVDNPGDPDHIPSVFRWEIRYGGRGYKNGQSVRIPLSDVNSHYDDIRVTVFTDAGSVLYQGEEEFETLEITTTTDPDTGEETSQSEYVTEREEWTDMWPEGRNLNLYDAVSDYVIYDAEDSSHMNGPEHEIVYVNELIDSSPVIEYQEEGIPYSDLAIVGIRINSSKEWRSFSQLSLYVKRGVQVDRVTQERFPETNRNDFESTNLFPEIAYALLTDNQIGLGNAISHENVDRASFIKASLFCEKNQFYWDGMITARENLREFLYTQASYCLLDFVVLGGKFSLVPSVPYYGDHLEIPDLDFKQWVRDNPNFGLMQPQRNILGETKAMFTDGNVRNLQVNFLSPEERQLVTLVVVYRKEEENGFPEQKTASFRLSETQSIEGWRVGSEHNPRETIDLSPFCTCKEQVEMYAKTTLRQKQLIDHVISFQTTPQNVLNLNPGNYIRVVSETTHFDRYSNGSINDEGGIQSQKTISNGDEIFYWKAGDTEVNSLTLSLSPNGIVQNMAARGSVFTKKVSEGSDRVYKVESIAYGEEGLIDVSASYVPLYDGGKLAILNHDDLDFEISGGFN